MDEPVLYTGAEPLTYKLSYVSELFKLLIDSGKHDEFIAASDKAGIKISAPPELVNLVKTFLFNNDLHTRSALASGIVSSQPRCPPADGA